MSSIAVTASATGAGVITLAAPITATNRTITLPDATGTLLSTATPGVPIGGPAFSAYQSTAQALSANTATKVLFQTSVYDTNSSFASSRFTPTVAGYYQLNTSVQIDTVGWLELMLFKNGVVAKNLFYSYSSNVQRGGGGGQLYLNGSTDYVEVYIRQANATNIAAGINNSWFDGAMVRSAT